MSILRNPIVSVRPRHIASGKRCEGDQCPVALALRDVFPNKEVYVEDDVLSVGDVQYKHGLSRQIELFDKLGIMEPFDFVLVESTF